MFIFNICFKNYKYNFIINFYYIKYYINYFNKKLFLLLKNKIHKGHKISNFLKSNFLFPSSFAS